MRVKSYWICTGAISMMGVAFLLEAQGSGRTPHHAQKVGSHPASTISPITITVLPFQQAVGSSETEVLGQGLSESLSNALKGISRITVADIESASRVEKAVAISDAVGKDEEAARIGQNLGVSFVVVGSYQVVGNQILVACRIVNVINGVVLPGSAVSASGRFPDDYAKLLDDLNSKIVAAFRIQPTGSEAKRLTSSPASQSRSALLLYNLGLAGIADGTQESLRKAVDAFAQCLAVDSGYAPAYAAKADAEAKLAEMKKDEPEGSALARSAEQDASTAVHYRPDLASSQRALARAHNAAGNYSAAAKAAEQALADAPNDAATKIALNRAQNKGEVVPTSEIMKLLEKQPWISFLFDQFPKVLVRNNCAGNLSVTFSPSSGEIGPKLSVLPRGARIVAVFPGSYTVSFESDAGDLTKQYELRRNELEELQFRCSDIMSTMVTVVNHGNSAAYVMFVRGARTTTILVNPGGAERRQMQTGDYTVSCAGAEGGRSLESRQATLTANAEYTYQCNVKRTLVYRPRNE